jgi:hypothetical protein
MLSTLDTAALNAGHLRNVALDHLGRSPFWSFFWGVVFPWVGELSSVLADVARLGERPCREKAFAATFHSLSLVDRLTACMCSCHLTVRLSLVQSPWCKRAPLLRFLCSDYLSGLLSGLAFPRRRVVKLQFWTHDAMRLQFCTRCCKVAFLHSLLTAMSDLVGRVGVGSGRRRASRVSFGSMKS